jgi:hypothetical protein
MAFGNVSEKMKALVREGFFFFGTWITSELGIFAPAA